MAYRATVYRTGASMLCNFCMRMLKTLFHGLPIDSIVKKLKKLPKKVAYLGRNSVVSEIFLFCLNAAQQPKWQNSCSQMWPIEQMYTELGFISLCIFELQAM